MGRDKVKIHKVQQAFHSKQSEASQPTNSFLCYLSICLNEKDKCGSADVCLVRFFLVSLLKLRKFFFLT